MRRPALPTLTAVAALALALSAAAPALADEQATPAPTSSSTADSQLPPADPTSPVVSTSAPTSTTPTDSATASDTSTLATAIVTPTPQIGGNGAYSYPFTLVPGVGGSTVAIEVAGTGVALSYTVDTAGKVTSAVIAAGTATLLKVTPHTVQLVLATGERVTIKIHGDSVRVKVKPRKGGPLRPGLLTPTQAASTTASPEADAADTQDSTDGADTAKGPKADHPGKAGKHHDKGAKQHAKSH